ncbi:MAG: glucose-1-phosphate adenylyltransferase [Chloroflexi bacterium]|nr:glucose-1-phosphate adenylyltransferase [Chloroflexota bacterium]
MNKVVAMILAGGEGHRLSILSAERAKPAVIFGGKYRIIDFTLSNCVNSGIFKVGVLTQYRPRSLNDHIGIGRPWDLDRARGGVTLLQPFTGRRNSDWYKGTADAVYQNSYFLEEGQVEEALILAGDHVYKMQYNTMVAFHRLKDADVTVGIVGVPPKDASRFGIIALDDEDKVVDFQEKPSHPKSNLASMGIYVFKKQSLIEALAGDAKRKSGHDFGGDIVPSMLGSKKIYGYRFRGYWRDVGTIDSYWEANMELLAPDSPLDLADAENAVKTQSQDRPPAKLGPKAKVSNSLVCSGCVINGEVRHSVLSPGVRVEEGVLVEDSILFDDVRVMKKSVVRRSIIDKEVLVGEDTRIGYSEDYTPNEDEPRSLHSGITIVGKKVRIPGGIRIGRNCKINAGVRESDFTTDFVASGKTVGRLEEVIVSPT